MEQSESYKYSSEQRKTLQNLYYGTHSYTSPSSSQSRKSIENDADKMHTFICDLLETINHMFICYKLNIDKETGVAIKENAQKQQGNIKKQYKVSDFIEEEMSSQMGMFYEHIVNFKEKKDQAINKNLKKHKPNK